MGLVEAVLSGDIEIVKTLIEQGSDLNMTPPLGTPIHVAAGSGRGEMVDLLIDAGADLDAGNSLCTPLQNALMNGHPAMALKLIAAGADVERTGSVYRTPPIALAALHGVAEEVQALIARGVDIDARAPAVRVGTLEDDTVAVKATALQLAARTGQAEIVAMLLAAGTDASMKDGDGLTTYDWARTNQHQAVMAALQAAGVGETAASSEQNLFDAAAMGNTERVITLLAQGVEVDMRDECRQGHLDVVRQLLAVGESVNQRGPERKTPLLMTAEYHRTAVAEWLIEAGAEVHFKDRHGATA